MAKRGRPPLARDMARTKSVGVKLRESEYDWVKKTAETNRISMSDFARLALDEALEKYENGGICE